MEANARYRLDVALLDDGATQRFVVVGDDDLLHRPATDWLGFLHDVGRSPNTVKSYGNRIAWYLSWTAQTADWRTVSLGHFAMWRRVLATTPVRKTNGAESMRSDATVALWMTPVRSFYEWADAHGLLTNDVAKRMTEVKYFAPGTKPGGEYGRTRRVLVPELKTASRPVVKDPEWINDEQARQRLLDLDLNVRDRFIIDLLYYTGIRAGEALSLFTADLHFGGGSPELGCKIVDPHFHVRVNNPVENGSRAKGCARTLYVHEQLVERYIDYVLERQRLLEADDRSPHALVNLYDAGRCGRAMTYAGLRKLLLRCSTRIGYELTGPHMLRHTLATRLVRGIDCEPQAMDVVQAILGHRSLNSTQVYTHDLERAKQAALAALAPRSVLLGPTR